MCPILLHKKILKSSKKHSERVSKLDKEFAKKIRKRIKLQFR